jgi:uncharacterized membrane protein
MLIALGLVWFFFGGLGVLLLRRMILDAGNKIIKRDWLYFTLIFILGFLGLAMIIAAISGICSESDSDNERRW